MAQRAAASGASVTSQRTAGGGGGAAHNPHLGSPKKAATTLQQQQQQQQPQQRSSSPKTIAKPNTNKEQGIFVVVRPNRLSCWRSHRTSRHAIERQPYRNPLLRLCRPASPLASPKLRAATPPATPGSLARARTSDAQRQNSQPTTPSSGPAKHHHHEGNNNSGDVHFPLWTTTCFPPTQTYQRKDTGSMETLLLLRNNSQTQEARSTIGTLCIGPTPWTHSVRASRCINRKNSCLVHRLAPSNTDHNCSSSSIIITIIIIRTRCTMSRRTTSPIRISLMISRRRLIFPLPRSQTLLTTTTTIMITRVNHDIIERKIYSTTNL